MGSMSGGAIRNLSGTAGMMIMLVSKRFETGFFFQGRKSNGTDDGTELQDPGDGSPDP